MKQSIKKTVVQYAFFLAGLLLNGFGVAFITKAALGTTPISSVPYTLSKILPRFTMGNFTIVLNLLMILLQVLILGKRNRLLDLLLQIPSAFLLGYVIDLSMWILTGFQPGIYPLKLVSLLLGCAIIAMGAYCEVVADVTMLPADGLTRAVSIRSGKSFGSAKIITDSTQASIALILGLIFLHGLDGVREGTIIGAFLIGTIVKLYARLFKLGEKIKAMK